MVAFLLAVVGCGTHEEPKPVTGDSLRSAMVGKKWMIEELFSRRVLGDLTMEFFSDGTVKLFGGCNELTGTYSLSDTSLTFGPMTSTRKSCGAAFEEQEYSLQSFLAAIDHVVLDGNDLHLISKTTSDVIVLTSGGGGLFW